MTRFCTEPGQQGFYSNRQIGMMDYSIPPWKDNIDGFTAKVALEVIHAVGGRALPIKTGTREFFHMVIINALKFLE